MTDESRPSTEDQSADGQIEQLRSRVEAQSAEIAALSARLDALETASSEQQEQTPQAGGRRFASSPRPQDSPSETGVKEQPLGEPPDYPVSPISRYLKLPQEDTADQSDESSASATRGPAKIVDSADTAAERASRWLLGGNWLARTGIVALILGVAFFVTLAIDRGWLGETERVILGAIVGLLLLGAAERNRGRFGVWAQTVSGGGLAILFLSIWAGFALFDLYGNLVALGLFVITTAVGVVQSLRYDSVGLAALAIFGGFATPLLLQGQPPDERVLLAYVLVLDIGVLALAVRRNWRWFTLLAYIWSLVLFAFWVTELDPSLGLSQAGNSAIFAIFAGASITFHVIRRHSVGFVDVMLIGATGLGYLLISYSLMFDAYRPWMGGFTALLGLCYAWFLALARRRTEVHSDLPPLIAATMAGLAALAVPIQLDGSWVTIAWSVEALVLVWLSFALRMNELRWFGLMISVVSAIWLLSLRVPEALSQDLTPFVNMSMLELSAAIALPALMAWLLHRRRSDLKTWESPLVAGFALMAAFFSVIAVPTQLDGGWVSSVWSAEFLIVMILSVRLKLVELRWFAYLLIATVLGRLAAVDTGNLDHESFWPVLNWRFLPFAVAVACLYAAQWFAQRTGSEFRGTFAREEALAAPVALFGLATLTTIWILSAEVLASADSALFDLSYSASENVSILGLTLLWGIYGATLMLAGVLKRWRWVRIAGLLLLIAAVVKLFAYDSQTLEQVYRVIAFLSLGVILVAGGFVYQRYTHLVRGFLFDQDR